MLVRRPRARCNGGMWLAAFSLWLRQGLARPVSPGSVLLSLAVVHALLLLLATWSALALAQASLEPEAARREAPPSVIAPPRPTPGDGQPRALHERLVRQAFEEADRNRDGQLSPEEAAALPGLAQRFGRVDSNHDGRVSRAEFMAAGGP